MVTRYKPRERLGIVILSVASDSLVESVVLENRRCGGNRVHPFALVFGTGNQISLEFLTNNYFAPAYDAVYFQPPTLYIHYLLPKLIGIIDCTKKQFTISNGSHVS